MAKAQNHFSSTTSEVISIVSENWKKDSVGMNRYRASVFKWIMSSKVDTVSKSLLFHYLGKPNQVSKFYSGIKNKNFVGYQYFVLCITDYPKKKYAGPFIEFVFDEKEEHLVEINEGDYCF